VQCLLVAESAQLPLVQTAGDQVAALPGERESNFLDTPPHSHGGQRSSSGEPDTEHVHETHEVRRSSSKRSRFVWMCIPLGRTSGLICFVRIKDENERERTAAAGSRAALTTDVQSATSLLSVDGGQAALEGTDAFERALPIRDQLFVNGTLLTRHEGVSVTCVERPMVRLFVLAHASGESLRCDHQISEELTSAKCFGAGNAPDFAARCCASVRRESAGRAVRAPTFRNAAPLHSAGHPFLHRSSPRIRRFSLRRGTRRVLLPLEWDSNDFADRARRRSSATMSERLHFADVVRRNANANATMCASAGVWSSEKRVTYGKLICTMVTYR
jgi:hypothetical protein